MAFSICSFDYLNIRSPILYNHDRKNLLGHMRHFILKDNEFFVAVVPIEHFEI